MPLPTKEPVAFRGVPSLGADKKMALSMTLTQKQVEAIFARQSALRGLPTSYPLEIDFDENKIYIGNTATNFTRFKEDGTREICLRSPTVSKPLAPISLCGNVIGKLNIQRDFDQDVADNVRKATEAEVSKRNERTIVVLDTPPAISHTKKPRSGATASTLAKKAMSNRLVSAQAAASNRPPISSTNSKPPIPVASSSPASRPKPPTSSSKPTPSSRSASASVSAPTSSTSKDPDLTSLRAHITHFIALEARTTQQVLVEVGGRSPTPETVREIEDTLTAVAQEVQPPKKGPTGPVKWELQFRSWEEIRPYEWPDLTTEQRTRMARHGRLAFGQMHIPTTDPLWEHFKTRVADINLAPTLGKGKTKVAPAQTLLKNSEFRGGMYPKDKKLGTKGEGATSGTVTKAKPSSAKSKVKKDPEDEVETKPRKDAAADTKERVKGNSISSTASSVPVTRIPKKKKIPEETALPPSSKSRTSIGSIKRESPPPPKSLRVPDEGHKRKFSELEPDGASEMEEGEVTVESDGKKRKIGDFVDNKSRLSNNHTATGDLQAKKSAKEKTKVHIKEESLPPKIAKDVTLPRVSAGSSSSRMVSSGSKVQRLVKEETEKDPPDMDRLKEQKPRSNGKRGRRATPSFSSDEEDEEPPKKVTITTRGPAPVPKSRPSQHPPSSKLSTPATKATSSRPSAPSPALPTDKDALRRRYHTCYARYMGVTSKFYEQRAKVEALLATDVDNISVDDDIEMMDTEELMRLRGEHEQLRDELQRIQHAHANSVGF